MFYFPIEDMERSLAKVRGRGGKVIGPIRTSTGDLAAACDDPQGGAFGLYQLTHHAG
jgi:predicted enzyme related to lactoylglutathione lyase